MSMRSWSIPVGRRFGIEIRIHLTFLFLLGFVWSTEAATQDATAALRGLALVGIVFGSVVLRELGHALVARYSGRGRWTAGKSVHRRGFGAGADGGDAGCFPHDQAADVLGGAPAKYRV